MTITIPPEVLEAGKDTAFNWLRSHMEDDVRVQHMTDEELGELVEAALLAGLKAWPGMPEIIVGINKGSIILPPKEDSDV